MPKRKTTNPILPMMLVGVGVMLIVGAFVVFFSSQNDPLSGALNPTPVAARIPFPDMARVSIGDAKAALDTGTAVFVDVRGEPYYSEGHIPGALSIPENEVPAGLEDLNPETWIITYCTWPAEESSARAAQVLLERGFTKVNPLKGGLDAWIVAGYPIEP